MKIEAGSLRQSAMLLLFSLSLAVVCLAGCRTHDSSFASPEDAAHVLENCAVETCTRLSSSLHLTLSLRPQVCSVGVLRGSFEANSDDALLKIQCSQDFQLLLLTQKSHGRWQYADSIPFPFGAHDVITVGLQKLVAPNYEDIIIHGDTVEFGTGIYQADFLVVRVSDGKLRIVLDTVEEGSADPPQVGGTSKWVEQQSLFDIGIATEKNPGSIAEKMTLGVGGKKIVVKREFDWQKGLGIFEPGVWTSTAESKLPK